MRVRTLPALFVAGSVFAAGRAAAEVPADAATAPAPSPAATGDVGDLQDLLGESVVTTASRTAERASDAPATIFTITADEIAASGARTVDEAVEFLAGGVWVVKPRDYGSPADIGGQGVLLHDNGRHVLVLLNGLTLNSQVTGGVYLHESLGVPLDAIDHIELMLGPGSVMYGSNAMLAVINIVTKTARDLGGLHVAGELGTAAPDHGAGFGGPGSHLGLRDRATVTYGKRWGEATDLTLALEWLHESSPTYFIAAIPADSVGDNSSVPGDATWGGLASHRMWAPSLVATVHHDDLRATLQANDYQRGMPLVGTFNDPAAVERRRGVHLDVTHDAALSEGLALTTRVYGAYSHAFEASNYGTTWCLAEEPNGCHFSLANDSLAGGVEQRIADDWHHDGTSVTTLGYDARLRWFADDSGTYSDLLTNAPAAAINHPDDRGTDYLLAAFVQHVQRPREWLSFNLGARVDSDSAGGSHLSPRAAVVVTVSEKTRLRASYNEAFRAPSQDELHNWDPTYRIQPAHLAPETVRAGEVALEQRVGPLMAQLRGYVASYGGFIESRSATADEIAAFNTAAHALSASADPSLVIVSDNLSNLKVTGAALAVSGRLPHNLTAAGTLNVSHVSSSDAAFVSRMPSWFGNAHLAWTSPSGYSVMAATVFGASTPLFYEFAAVDGARIDARLDLRLAVSGPIAAVRGLRWRVTAGYDVSSQVPYAVVETNPATSGPVARPDVDRAFGLLSISYTPAAP